MNLVQVPRGGRLGHELPEALIQRALAQQIRAGALGASLVVQRRPLPEDSRRIKIDVTVGPIVVGHFPSAFSDDGPRNFHELAGRPFCVVRSRVLPPRISSLPSTR